MTYQPARYAFESAEDVNSKTTTTGTGWSGSTWTGAGELPNRDYVRSSIISDVAGTVYFEFGYDGVTWESTFPVAGFDLGTFHEYHGADLGGRYFRIRIVFDSLPTSVIIKTYFSDNAPSLNSPLSQNISGDQDATTVKAVVHGEVGSTGEFGQVRINKGNAIITADFGTEVDLGNIPGYSLTTKFGRNPDIDTASTPEDIWASGGIYTGHPLGSPETVEVFSSSSSDTSGGTGARTIVISGLKTSSSTAYEEETITMAGTLAATSVSTWWRINRAYVVTAGTAENNVGTITIRHATTTANVFGTIQPDTGQTLIAAFTVPALTTCIIKRVRVTLTRSSGTAGSANVTLRAREPGSVYRAIRSFELQTGPGISYTETGGAVLPAGTDIKLRVESVSDNNTIAESAFELLLISD